MKKIKLFISFILCSFLIFSLTFCATSAKIQDKAYISNTDCFFHVPQTDDCYIFFRMYDPVYKNPLYIANLLKSGIALTEVNSFNASHVAISFNLEDCFLGLTSLTVPQLKYEICSDEKNNEYMIQCDKNKSVAYIFGIKVTPEERDKAIELIQNNFDVEYDSKINFMMVEKSVKRSMKKTKEEKKFERYYHTGKNIEEINSIENNRKSRKFVCSGFVGYVLYNSVQSVRDFFNQNTLDYRFLTVTDISNIPGVEKLFESTWSEYEQTAAAFVQEHKEFKPYIENCRIAKTENKDECTANQ